MVKLLAIDDNEDILFTIKAALEEVNSNIKVIGANGGAAGIKAAKKIKPDLILLDIMMPGKDGWTVNKELKVNDETKNIPVVFLTARTDESSEKKGLRDGSAFLRKPFDIDVLYNTIKDVLDI